VLFYLFCQTQRVVSVQTDVKHIIFKAGKKNNG